MRTTLRKPLNNPSVPPICSLHSIFLQLMREIEQADPGVTTPADRVLLPPPRSVAPLATQTQSKPEASVETVPAVAGLGQNAAVDSCQASGLGLRRQALKSTTDLESRSKICSRSSEQSDGSKSIGKERRQRHRERYPPPPGPPPSPTPTRRRRKISPTRCSSSRSRSCERSASEHEGGRQKNTVRCGCWWIHVRYTASKTGVDNLLRNIFLNTN